MLSTLGLNAHNVVAPPKLSRQAWHHFSQDRPPSLGFLCRTRLARSFTWATVFHTLHFLPLHAQRSNNKQTRHDQSSRERLRQRSVVC